MNKYVTYLALSVYKREFCRIENDKIYDAVEQKPTKKKVENKTNSIPTVSFVFPTIIGNIVINITTCYTSSTILIINKRCTLLTHIPITILKIETHVLCSYKTIEISFTVTLATNCTCTTSHIARGASHTTGIVQQPSFLQTSSNKVSPEQFSK